MKVVAFLQNQWFKDPPRMQRLLETQFKGDRERFVRTWLFYRCLTGQRLKAALGEEWVDKIIWEEVSQQIGGQASAAFPADPTHIAAVLEKHQPTHVIALGKIAQAGLSAVWQPGGRPGSDWALILGPHPAARHATVLAELELIRQTLDTLARHR